jgi:hypothetical protein
MSQNVIEKSITEVVRTAFYQQYLLELNQRKKAENLNLLFSYTS